MRVLACVGVVVLAFATSGWSFGPGAFDCKNTPRMPYADKIFCSYPELVKQDKEIVRQFQQLLSRFRGDDRKIFVAGERSWKVDRLDCGGRVKDDMPTCFKMEMDKRLAFFARLRGNPSLLRSTVADYRNVELWYVKRFAKEYEGKEVSISGGMTDMPRCDKPDGSLRGHIADDTGTMIVELRGMERRADWNLVCSFPQDNWDAEVRLDSRGEPYLYMTTLQGQPLPEK